MEEILSGVFTWPWFSAPHGYNFNGFLILDPAGNICIDPVEPAAEVIDELARRGISRIVLTNRNHVRAANRVRQATGARTAIHPDDVAYAVGQGAQLDDRLSPEESVGPLTIIGVPGKSPGEVALYWPTRRLLIVGDAVIGNPAGQFGLLKERVMDDPPRLRASVRGLLQLDFDTLLAGDGVSVLSGAKDKLRQLVNTFPH